MDTKGLGRVLYALGMIGLGALSLIYVKYALQWQPVPAAFPEKLAYASGAILCLGGVGLLIRRFRMTSAAVLMAFLAVWVVVLKIPPAIAATPGAGGWQGLSGVWLGVAEDTGMMCGAWTLMALADQTYNEASTRFVTDGAGLRLAQTLFGVACLVFGVSHFAYLDFTASMIPAWLPQHQHLAMLTGAGHILAGVALITGVLSRLAAILEATMMTLFVLLLHIPMVAGHPAPDAMQLDWTMLFVAATLSASAWAIAGGLNDKPLFFGKNDG